MSQPELNSLDVVIPFYNPPAGWAEEVLKQYTAFRESSPYSKGRLIMVNDGSTEGDIDQGLELLSTSIQGFEIISLDKNEGKGNALRNGVAASTADYCMITDIDLPYTVESMIQVAGALAENRVVVGIRDKSYYRKLPVRRRALSNAVGFLVKLLFQIPVPDTQCGLKAFGPAGREIFLSGEAKTFVFDVEFIRNAHKSPEVEIQMVPVKLREGITFTAFGLKKLMVELKNLFRIILKS